MATTAEMAAAAGIAEGTIFRVFPDKAALLHAAIAKTMDPVPVQTALAAIPADASITEQLHEAARVLGDRYDSVTTLVGMVRAMPHADKPHAEAHRVATESMAAVAQALTRFMERHVEQLTVDPRQAALLLRGLVFTNAHHMMSDDERLSTEQLVSALCHGILGPESR